MQTILAYIIVGAWIVALFLLIFFGLRSEFKRRKILKNGIRTKAIVINNKVSRGASARFFYTPIVSFNLENGDRFEVERSYGTNTNHYNVGDSLYIYYLKENPTKFVFEQGKERKENFIIFTFLLILVVTFLVMVRLLFPASLK